MDNIKDRLETFNKYAQSYPMYGFWLKLTMDNIKDRLKTFNKYRIY